MKKLLYLFAASLLVFSSCSKDDDSSNSTSSILPKKIVTTYSDGDIETLDYVYSGNKIVSNTDQNGLQMKYTYTGDFITRIEELDKDGKLDLTTDYTYLNGKLNTSIEKSAAANTTDYYKTKYTYNADGTISYENFRGLIATGVEQEYGATGKYTFKDGNLIKLEVSYDGTDYSYVYEYDTKNNPYKNILGYSLLLEDEDSSINNVIKQTSTSGNAIRTTSYTYDVNNYPTQKITNFTNGTLTDSQTTQFFY